MACALTEAQWALIAPFLPLPKYRDPTEITGLP